MSGLGSRDQEGPLTASQERRDFGASDAFPANRPDGATTTATLALAPPLQRTIDVPDTRSVGARAGATIRMPDAVPVAGLPPVATNERHGTTAFLPERTAPVVPLQRRMPGIPPANGDTSPGLSMATPVVTLAPAAPWLPPDGRGSQLGILRSTQGAQPNPASAVQRATQAPAAASGQGEAEPVQLSEERTVQPAEQPTSMPAVGAPPTAAGGGAPAADAVSGMSSDQLDDLAKRLAGPIIRRIKADMLLDRERRGVRTDAR